MLRITNPARPLSTNPTCLASQIKAGSFERIRISSASGIHELNFEKFFLPQLGTLTNGGCIINIGQTANKKNDEIKNIEH